MVDLLIDGNYILSKLVFTLHKNNLLYGGLHKALEHNMSTYRKWYPFTNVYLVSDSKEKSWRKKLTASYKSGRKKNTDIDWEFVYTAYAEFKQGLSGFIKVLEAPHIEGDDWLSFLAAKANSAGRSVVIVSNDYDIKQLVKYSLEPLTINLMTNEMYNKEKLFIPKKYQIFLNRLQKIPNDDIFNTNDNFEFLKLIEGFLKKYEVFEIDSTECLVIKLIAGDKSDNIFSAWSQTKNGKKRGIGEKGAKTIYDEYLKEFGDIVLGDPDLYENIADLICEKKKISKTQIESIVGNLRDNVKLIDLGLENIPVQIIQQMEAVYQLRHSKEVTL